MACHGLESQQNFCLWGYKEVSMIYMNGSWNTSVLHNPCLLIHDIEIPKNNLFTTTDLEERGSEPRQVFLIEKIVHYKKCRPKHKGTTFVNKYAMKCFAQLDINNVNKSKWLEWPAFWPHPQRIKACLLPFENVRSLSLKQTKQNFKEFQEFHLFISFWRRCQRDCLVKKFCPTNIREKTPAQKERIVFELDFGHNDKVF